jgi:tetratricopeptide (TPR) repeat protein
VVLVVIWLAFNLQTLVSINVPSLAIWGWVLSGLILSHSYKKVEGANYDQRQRRARPKDFLVPIVVCSMSAVSVLPLVSRDVILARAFTNNKIPEISRAALYFPRDADLMAGIAIAYGKLGLSEQSLDLARQAIRENPNSARAWEIIVMNSVSSLKEKNKAVINLRRLDPFYVNKID